MTKTFTLHDLLQFHLEGLHSSSRMISCSPFNSMDRKTAIYHRCNIIVFKEDDTIGMFYYSTIKMFKEILQWIIKDDYYK